MIKVLPVLLCAFVSCTTIKPFKYFQLHENQVDSFIGYYVKDRLDSIYMRIEKLVGQTHSPDTFFERYTLTYKTETIEGHKAFYPIRNNDTAKRNTSFGSNHFLFSALIFENKKVFIAPAYELKGLKRLKFSDFKYQKALQTGILLKLQTEPNELTYLAFGLRI